MTPADPPPQTGATSLRASLALAALLRAYIDPGSGSFIIQIAIPTVLANASSHRVPVEKRDSGGPER